MKRDGLIIAGGVLAVIRGTFGAFVGLASLSTVGELEALFPGIAQIVTFEILLAFMILGVGIFALVKSNDRRQARAIRLWGIAIVVAGVIDAFWSIAIVGGAASAFGSIAALTLIGCLLVFGARRLGKTLA